VNGLLRPREITPRDDVSKARHAFDAFIHQTMTTSIPISFISIFIAPKLDIASRITTHPAFFATRAMSSIGLTMPLVVYSVAP